MWLSHAKIDWLSRSLLTKLISGHDLFQSHERFACSACLGLHASHASKTHLAQTFVMFSASHVCIRSFVVFFRRLKRHEEFHFQSELGIDSFLKLCSSHLVHAIRTQSRPEFDRRVTIIAVGLDFFFFSDGGRGTGQKKNCAMRTAFEFALSSRLVCETTE